MHRDELRAQVDHVVAQDPLDPPLQAILQPDHRETLHALVQRQRQGAAADHAVLVFQHEPADAALALFQDVHRQAVLEVDVRRLAAGALAETGATMVGVAFQVQAVGQLVEHLGLANAGHAAEQDKITLGHRSFEGVEQEGTHGLVAAADPRVVDAGLVLEPLLDDLRTQAAAEAIQVAVGVGPGEVGPGLDAFGLDRPGHQLVPEDDRRLLALLLVAGADPLSFVVGHQRQVDHPGKGALAEFDRRTGIHHRPVVEEDFAVVGNIDGHQITSTAVLCRSTSSPIGASSRPSSAASARKAALPSGVTAINSPPLVCGSHSTSLCRAWIRPSLSA